MKGDFAQVGSIFANYETRRTFASCCTIRGLKILRMKEGLELLGV